MSNQNQHKPGYKHTPLGWIPEEWEITRLGKLVKLISGLHLDPSEYDRSGFGTPYFTGPTDYTNCLTKLAKWTKKKAALAKANDVLITVKGSGVGSMHYLSLPEVAIGRQIMAIRDDEHSSTSFIYHYLLQKEYQFQELAKGNMIPGLTRDDILTLEIKTPSVPERLKIAAILSTWDEAINKIQQLIAQLQQRNKGLMQLLLTAKENWKEYRIGELLKEVKRPVAWNDEELYHLISVRRRSGGAFFRESLYGKQILTKQLYTAEAGDFLISKMQIVHGASAVVPPEFAGMKISGSYIAVHAKDDDVMDINFFNWLSKTKWFYKLTYVSSYGVHIEKMTFDFDDFKRRKIMLPSSVGEQKNIVAILQTAADEVKLYEHKLGALQQQKKGLMQKLLTGEVRVKTQKQ